MDVTEVIALVAAALGSAPFRITGTTLQSPPISTLLTGHLDADALVLDGAAEAGRDASGITVTGRLAGAPADGPVRGLSGLAASARFTVADGVAQVRVTFTGLAPGWKPSTTVPVLAGTVLDAVTYTSPWIALDSANADALPGTFPRGYGFAAFSAKAAAALVRGLSMGGTAVLTGLPPDLGLLAGTSWQVSGEVALLPSAAAACLVTAPTAHPFSVAGFAIPFSVALAAAPLPGPPSATPGQDGGPAPLPTTMSSLMQFEADIEKDVGSPGAPYKITLPVLLRTTPDDSGVYALGAALPGTLPITLTQLASLVDGHALDGQAPKAGGFPGLDEIVLEDVSVVFAPGATQPLVSVSATVALANPDPGGWQVFGGLIVFKGMAVTFYYATELDSLVTEVTAEAVLAGGTLDASIGLPSLTFTLQLGEETSIDIKALVDQLAGASVTMPQITCTTFELSGDVLAGSYRFRADVTDDWSFSVGGRPFALTQVGFSLNYDGKIPSGQANGVFTVAGLELYAIAVYDGTTSSWSFEGGTVVPVAVDLTDLAAGLAADLGISVPAAHAPAGLTLENLNVFYDTLSEHLEFAGLAAFEIAGVGCELGLSVAHSPGSTAFTGMLFIGLQAFVVDFSTDPQDTRLFASWSAEDSEGGLDLKGLSEELGFTPPQIPADLDLRLTSASFTYDITAKVLVLEAESAAYGKAAFIAGRDASGQRGFVFGVLPNVAVTLDLTTIDVIGKLVPSDDIISLSNLRIVGASSALPAYTPPPEVQQVIGPVVNSGLMLSAELKAGTAVDQTLTVRFGGSAGGPPTDTSPSHTAIAARAPGGASPVPQAIWINVQRSFGPVHFERIGFTITSQAELSLLLDAAVSVAGLTVGLTGLQASMPIRSPYVPSFDLAGLQVQFNGGGVVIGGGLEKVPGSTPTEYMGELTVQLAQFGVTMFGSYTTVNGQPSLFAFLFLDAPLGGPALFFVTGLAGGFGYNRSLRLPDISGVESYPLVAGAMGKLDANTTESELNTYIQPTQNEDWLAAGVRFTSFEMVQSFALLTVAFGTHAEIGLLGESTLSVPTGAAIPVALADMVLLVDVSPSDGQLAVNAQLTPRSYVLDQAARLSGGFAFYAWFPPSPQPGDFVVTLGGYNPYFTPPSYYPQQVPRLGLSWQVSSELSVTGGLYFALTPSVLMAGGYLRATWNSGDISAWFDAQADFLIRFKPFQYLVTVTVSIGVSFTLNLLVITKRITIHLGVSVTLWGPPFGGTATVDLSVFSFTIAFAAPPPGPPDNLKWADFRHSFLPPADAAERRAAAAAVTAPPGTVTPTDSLVTISAAAGLLGTVRAADATVCLVSPASLRIVVATQLPSTSATVVAGSAVTPSGAWTDQLGVGPMGAGAGAGALKSALTITIKRDGAPDSDRWTASAITGGVPKGLYLNTGGQMQTDGTVGDALLGVVLTPAPPSGGSTLPVLVALLLDADPPHRDFEWSAVVPPDNDSFDQNTAMTRMQSSLTDPGVAQVRRDLLAALRQQGLAVAADVSVAGFAAAAPGLMASPPQLRLLGEEVQ